MENIIIPETGIPLSHGTHVASIALQGLSDVRFVGYVGDFTAPGFFAPIRKNLKRLNIPFVNMSFGLTDSILGDEDIWSVVGNMEYLVKENPGTLFLVAPSNTGKDNDTNGYNDFPATFDYENILVVGALDASELQEGLLPDYEMASFSSYGIKSVDILSPGVQVMGAMYGGGTIPLDGTSMATPYALNKVVLPTYLANPHLSVMEVKEIVMKTAYIPDLQSPFPVKSGGIIYPSRAKAVAELLNERPDLSIEEAVLTIRRDGHLNQKGELSTEEYLAQLVSFWHERRVVSNKKGIPDSPL